MSHHRHSRGGGGGVEASPFTSAHSFSPEHSRLSRYARYPPDISTVISVLPSSADDGGGVGGGGVFSSVMLRHVLHDFVGVAQRGFSAIPAAVI
jgi:hypothetical protein